MHFATLGRAFAALVFSTIPAFAYAESIVREGDFLAIIGDSITEQKSYSVFMQDYVLMCQPTPATVMQFGWSGDTATGFVGNKLDNDVLRFKPTLATTCFGMNDGRYGPIDEGIAGVYREQTQRYIDGMKAGGVRTVVIGSPGVVDWDTWSRGRVDPATYNRNLGTLGLVGRELAQKNNMPFADVYGAMMNAMIGSKAKYGPRYHIAGSDGVHPAANGHVVMAYAFLKAMGFDGNVGTITLSNGAATATPGHKVLSSSNGQIELESTRYPFCFFAGADEDPNCPRGILPFVPFNQDLNRFTLIVKNAAPKTRITWGDGGASRTFTAEQLDKGINLAAEFLDNPFLPEFERVHRLVRAQQDFETLYVKQFVFNVPQFKRLMPEDADTFDKLVADGKRKSDELFVAAKSAVTPVKHTIKIERAD